MQRVGRSPLTLVTQTLATRRMPPTSLPASSATTPTWPNTEHADLLNAADQWHDALDHAEELRDELAIEVSAAFENGLSMRGIAEAAGLHRATVRKMLDEAGYL